MVKRPRIATKPKSGSQNADVWVNQGGIDPETSSSSSLVASVDEDQEKPYPHRVSFDMNTAQYKRLKLAAFSSERSMNDILREATEDWLSKYKY